MKLAAVVALIAILGGAAAAHSQKAVLVCDEHERFDIENNTWTTSQRRVFFAVKIADEIIKSIEWRGCNDAYEEWEIDAIDLKLVCGDSQYPEYGIVTINRVTGEFLAEELAESEQGRGVQELGIPVEPLGRAAGRCELRDLQY